MDAAEGDEKVSRWEQQEKDLGTTPELPDVGPWSYLVEAFRDLGMYQNMGMGTKSALSYQEITAYGNATGGFDRLEVLTLRAMSAAYIEGHNVGHDVFGKAPWPELDELGDPIEDDEEDYTWQTLQTLDSE